MPAPDNIPDALDDLHARLKDVEATGGGAPDAIDVSFTPSGSIAATNVQAAIEEVAAEAGAATDHGTLSGLTDDDHTQYQKESEKGAANGYAGLGADSLVPQDQLGTGTQDGTKFLRDDGTWQPADAAAHAADTSAAHDASAISFAPGGTIAATDVQAAIEEVAAEAGGGGASEPWHGNLHVAFGDGNPTAPHVLWGFQFTAASVAGPTPTQIGTAVGRLVMFRCAAAITVQNIRYHCNTGNNNNIHTFAIYNALTGARVWTATVPNAGSGWNVIALGGSPFVLDADTPYWFGIGANTTSAVSCFRSPASFITGSIGVTTIPGSLAAYAARYAQVALTAGAWPDPLPTLATAAFAEGTNGTIPIVFLDAA